MARRASSPPDDLLTCAEAARRLGYGRTRLTQLAREGVIPSRIGFGGRRLVRWADVLAWDAAPRDDAKGGRPRGSGVG